MATTKDLGQVVYKDSFTKTLALTADANTNLLYIPVISGYHVTGATLSAFNNNWVVGITGLNDTTYVAILAYIVSEATTYSAFVNYTLAT